MAEQKVYSQSDTALKVGAIGTAEVTIMGICAAAPVMCIGGSMGLLAAQTGRGVSLSAAVATLVVVLIGLSYGKLSEKFNRCGGTWAYMQQCWGQKAGLWTAFIYFGVLITTSGCPPSIFSIYLNYLVPAIPLWLCWFICVVPVCIITWNGIELSAKATVIIWFIQMILLIYPAIKIIAMAPGGFNFSTSISNAFTPTFGAVGVGLAALTWVWAYVGFEFPAYMGEELKGGSKAVKFAVPMSGLLVGIIYIVACWVWTATLPADVLAQISGSGTFLADYATLIGYAAGDKLVAIGTIVGAFACAMAFYSLMPRFLYDLGREGIMPKSMAKVNKHQIPHIGMFTYGIIAFFTCMYAMYGYSDSGLFDGINDWFVIMGITACTAYGFICLGNIKDGWKDSSLWNGIILRKIVPIITALILLYMIYSSVLTAKYLIFFICWIVLAFIFAFAHPAGKKGNSAA